MKRLLILFVVLMLVTLACRLSPSEPRTLDLYPSPTFANTSTPYFVEITTTHLPTLPPQMIVVSATPVPSGFLCVVASESVYLRPSPDVENYPIAPLAKGDKLADSGSRNGVWAFVSVADQSGWVNTEFVEQCK